MDLRLLWRAALLQAAAVGALFLVLALLLDDEFFREWGAVTGPVAWTACAILTGRLLGLTLARIGFAAVASGALAALVGVAAGHLPGLVVAVLAFGVACASRVPAQAGAGAGAR